MIDTKGYGGKIQNAVKAVVQMHEDTSKLLQVCDNTIGKGKDSVFGGYATKDLTYSYQAEMWMAYGVYRYYYTPGRPGHTLNQPGLVEGVTVVFVPDPPKVADQSGFEPLFIIGQIEYGIATERPKLERQHAWDLWNGFFQWSDKQELSNVIHPQKLDDDATARIKNMKLIAVPLYGSIKKIEDVKKLMEQVRESP